MEANGARLKKLRLEKGLSLEEAHKKTKIHLNILKAIEEDSLIGLNPVYIKGFLKIYCKFLGVDPKDYIGGYQEPQIIAKKIPEPSEKPVSFLEATSLNLSSFKKTIFIIIAILFFSVGLFNLGKIISSKRGPKSKEGKLLSLPVTETIEKRKKSTPKLTKTQDKDTSAKQQQQAGPDASKNNVASALVRLGMRAKEDCWVHLVVDGRVVFHGILKKGSFETWQARDKIEFSLGNAGVIDLELSGKPIPPLGRRGQAVKNISITKEEGLVVGR